MTQPTSTSRPAATVASIHLAPPAPLDTIRNNMDQLNRDLTICRYEYTSGRREIPLSLTMHRLEGIRSRLETTQGLIERTKRTTAVDTYTLNRCVLLQLNYERLALRVNCAARSQLPTPPPSSDSLIPNASTQHRPPQRKDPEIGWGARYAAPRPTPRAIEHPAAAAAPRLSAKAAEIKDKQIRHLAKLTLLSNRGEWDHLAMHTLHEDSGFDWWMFPINLSSASYGSRYQLSSTDIDDLKQDRTFMDSYRAGVILVAKSWGWDLENNRDITNDDQNWSKFKYQVRLGKMLQSLQLFGEKELHRRLVAFLAARNVCRTLQNWIQPYLAPIS